MFLAAADQYAFCAVQSFFEDRARPSSHEGRTVSAFKRFSARCSIDRDANSFADWARARGSLIYIYTG